MTTLATSESQEIVDRVRPLADLAREQLQELHDAENAIKNSLHALCERLWSLGKTLFELRGEIGYGKWAIWLEGNLPKLGETEATRRANAHYAMHFYASNPNVAMPQHFSVESIRKCIFHLAPEKERPQLEGSREINIPPHWLTPINGIRKWANRVEDGLEPTPDPETFRNDAEPLIKIAIKYGGADWVKGMLT